MNTNTNHWVATAKSVAKKAIDKVHVENGRVDVTVYDFNKPKTSTITNTIVQPVQPVVVPHKTDWVAISGLIMTFIMCSLAVYSFVRRKRKARNA